jgi:hypothetical protein
MSYHPLVETTNRLVSAIGLEKLLPQLVAAIDKVEGGGEKRIDHAFRQGLWMILAAMGAYVPGRLIRNYLNKKLIESRA